MATSEKENQPPERIEDVLRKMEFKITAIPTTEETLSSLRQVYDLGQRRVIYITSLTEAKKEKRTEDKPPYHAK
ncbi:hypothetical protein HYV88_01795 [Candidatus Woesearchaeota archaeon]|nr:hypothetical protein [Candidatus Woesearchaeota archaeon]